MGNASTPLPMKRLTLPLLLPLLLLGFLWHSLPTAAQGSSPFPPLPDGYSYQMPTDIVPTPFIHNGRGGGDITCSVDGNRVTCAGDTWANGVSPGLWGRNDFHLQYSPAISVVGVALYIEPLNSEITTILWSGYPSGTQGTIQVAAQETALVSWQSPLSITTHFDKVQLSEKEGMRVVTHGLNHPRTVGSSKHTHYQTQIALIVADTNTPPPDPPPLDSVPFAANCTYVLTSTAVISAGGGLTQTVEISQSHTVSSNLLLNPTFEQLDGIRPYGWVPSLDGVVWQGSDIYYNHDPAMARSGSRSLTSAGNFNIEQGVALSSGTYLAGMFAHCTHPSGCQSETAVLRWNGVSVATFAPISSTATFQLISDTVVTGGGAPLVGVRFQGAGGFIGNLFIDDFFVVPWDPASNQAICAADYYTDTTDIPPDDPPDDFPIPDNDDFITCYACVLPTNILSVGQWMRWLQCRLHNFFYCSLRIWFLHLSNWLLGLYHLLQALLGWLPNMINSLLGWLFTAIVQIITLALRVWDSLRLGLATFAIALLRRLFEVDLIQLIWNGFAFASALWDILWGWLRFVVDAFKTLYTVVITLVELLLALIEGVTAAWQADAFALEVVFGLETSPTPGDIRVALDQAGPNQEKLLWFVIAAMSMVDHFSGTYLHPILTVVKGCVGFGTISWIIKQFYDIIPT